MINFKHACAALVSCALSVTAVYGQNQLQRKAITQKYDLVKLQQLEKDFAKKFLEKKQAAQQMAIQQGWETFITKEDGSFDELVDVSPDGYPIYNSIDNVAAAVSTRANHLNIGGSLGLNLDGQDMVAYVWDGGATRTTHQEFDGPGGNNRVSIVDGVTGLNGNSFHAQHVTGTIVASGFSAAAKGMAPRAEARTSDWNNDLPEATTQAANGMLLSNHSYGYRASGIPDWYFGAYISLSRDWDQLLRNSPYYLMVVAAGNDGADNYSNGSPLSGNSSFDKLSGRATCKNNLVVANGEDANINPDGSLNSVVINNSSSEGPTDDLRIKPDITGNGTSLYSTLEDHDSHYGNLTGTSMAAPNVTGTLLLLQQHHSNLTGSFMKAATLKGLALHTADDAGISGPDAVFGWGLLNAKFAAEVLSNEGNGSIVDELTLNPGQTYTITVDANGIDPLMASICWTDLAGTANTGTTNDPTPVLVNDLDVRVTKNSTTYLPYKLTGVNSNTLADNNVDPYERIAVNNASGSYTITVTHKGSLSGGSQDFSLIVTGITSEPVVCEANVPTNVAAGSVATTSANITWDAVPAATYDLRYRVVGTSSWTTVAVNTNAYSLTGLTSETQYEVQVRSKCDGGDNSAYSSSAVFTTPEVQLNYCASQGNNSSYEFIQSVALGAFSNASGNNGGYADFTSSIINVTKDEATSFTLTPGFASSSYNETWKLFADLNKDGDFTDAGETLYTSSNTSSIVSGSITIPASAITGTTRLRVSMKYNAASSPCESFSYGEVEDYTLNIQDGVAEPCNAPAGLATNNVTTNSIDVSWAAVSNATSYLLQHRVSGGTWNTQTVSGTSTTVSGLADNTTYDFRVASDCGSETSTYSSIASATTDEEQAPVCDAPINLQSSNITTTSFTVTWDAVSGSTGYIVEFRVVGGSWGSTTSASNSINLTGGTPNTSYEVRVKTNCGGGLESGFSSVITVTTDEEAPVCDAPTNVQASNVDVTSFDVSWSAVSGAVNYNVDVRPVGGSWSTQTVSTNSISLSGLSANTSYEVRIQTECSAINSSYSSVITVTTDEEPVTGEYCASESTNSSSEWIKSIRFGNTTYTTNNNGGYLDNTSTVINLTSGGSVYIQLTPGFTSGFFWTNSYPEYWNVYIDFNKDGDFDDAGELWASTNGTSTGVVSGTIALPSGVTGTTRMRVSMKRNTGASPCEIFTNGEVEDYTVDFGGSTQSNAVTSIENVGTGLLKSDVALSVSPNPTTSSANISLALSPEHGTSVLNVYDVTGRLVTSKTVEAVQAAAEQNVTINLSDNAAGTYLIVLETASGDKKVERLIKQ